MKVLDVPLFLQKKNSVDCGPVCTQMALAFYGIKKTLKELKKELNYDKIGTSSFDNANLLLKNGFKVTIITAQPLLFSSDKTKNLQSKKDILDHIKTKLIKNKKYKVHLKSLENYLDIDGNIKIEIPSFFHIKDAIDNNHPVIALMNSQTLGSNEGNFHFVVVCGYRENEVFINNPWPISTQKGWFPIDRFLYGVHASTCAELDNGVFIIPYPYK